ncbi:FliA/WhiG family RNA polymerase sigma factor [Desulfovibrio desulfuricans]|uniref:FliA/WhiG family RNA polymerase sigma factor n=1 Tax=Desulfovibrio desulfuricans TaxID=876 RepID=UPI0003B3EDC4|nr:FliA/WhiG family RNA polymerase sigma factor [Desulfovibrio desulfuricans]QTO40672.1 FliA/WhiG family RNA polymerase sigma factor [Desulfovibrio desulfuricans]
MKTGTAQAQAPCPWEALETGATPWESFSPAEQESVVRHYAPKIRFLALRLKAKLPRSIELGELISSGTLGLMEALGKFRPQLGIRFETYAESRIKGAMLDELRRLDWFPRSLRQRVRVLDEAMRKVEHEQGRQATEDELQKITGLDMRDVRQGLEALQNQLWISLDAIQDTISGEGPEGGEPFRSTALQELIERVAPLIDRLTPREKLVLSLYYTDELNMRETAEVMGITEGRVSQLHSQALSRLRKEFHNLYGEGTEI